MGIGKNIKRLAKEKNMTIKQVAIQSDINLDTLYSITKKDDVSLKPDMVKKLTKTLGCSTDQLLNTLYYYDVDKMLEDEYRVNRDPMEYYYGTLKLLADYCTVDSNNAIAIIDPKGFMDALEVEDIVTYEFIRKFINEK